MVGERGKEVRLRHGSHHRQSAADEHKLNAAVLNRDVDRT